MEGIVERWDGNRVRPRVKTIRMGLMYRILIGGRWYFLDTRGFQDDDVTKFFSTLEPGATVFGEVYYRRGHACISWIIGENAVIAPENVFRIGLLCAVAFIFGFVSLKVFAILINSQLLHGVLGGFFWFLEVPLMVIFGSVAMLGLLVALLGMLDMLNPRKVRAMFNYRHEVARRARGGQS